MAIEIEVLIVELGILLKSGNLPIEIIICYQ